MDVNNWILQKSSSVYFLQKKHTVPGFLLDCTKGGILKDPTNQKKYCKLQSIPENSVLKPIDLMNAKEDSYRIYYFVHFYLCIILFVPVIYCLWNFHFTSATSNLLILEIV